MIVVLRGGYSLDDSHQCVRSSQRQGRRPPHQTVSVFDFWRSPGARGSSLNTDVLSSAGTRVAQSRMTATAEWAGYRDESSRSAVA